MQRRAAESSSEMGAIRSALAEEQARGKSATWRGRSITHIRAQERSREEPIVRASPPSEIDFDSRASRRLATALAHLESTACKYK